jgi:glycosyltransferase involved in cell wall biosynthesis
VISVIIGTQNSERALLPTLTNLVAGAAAGVVREVIVADAGSSDGTSDVADVAGCELIVSHAPLAARLKQAVGRARAAWLLFLRAGIVLDAGWTEEVMRFIEQSELAGSAGLSAAVFRRGARATAVRSALTEALSIIRATLAAPTAEQGLLISKRLYDQLGGHRNDVRDTEAELTRRVGRSRTAMLRSSAVKVSEG